MPTVREQITQLGEALVQDAFPYLDVVCKPDKGIIPRGLIYEEDNRDPNGRTAIIVGINPGQAKPHETARYKLKGCTYDVALEYWKKHLGYHHAYYVRSRGFVDQAGLPGPILWTELVHCQSAKGVPLSVQTIRECINKHLIPQIRLLSRESVLIGVGREAYKILAYRFPKRMVLGIPHPTGSYGQWHKLMTKGKLLDLAKGQLAEILASDEPVARIFQCTGDDCRFR